MSSRFLKGVLAAAAALSMLGCRDLPAPGDANALSPLRVCSDPNNLPFSNSASEGFENRIAELIGRELGTRVEYTWFAQRRGFLRNTLSAGLCDVVMGVPENIDAVDTTRPYYRSTYVFLTREHERHTLNSLDDPTLRALKIGVHIVGDDYANPPPVHALGRRNIVNNVTGYSIYGDYSQPHPPARLVEAVADGAIDVAILWGPVAGYFGARQRTPLRVTPISPESDGPALPFVFAISMGVRKGEEKFLQTLQAVLDRRQSDIDEILRDYGVPTKL